MLITPSQNEHQKCVKYTSFPAWLRWVDRRAVRELGSHFAAAENRPGIQARPSTPAPTCLQKPGALGRKRMPVRK